MSLIKCPNCGREISDKAAKCPHCGHQLEGSQTKRQPPSQMSESPRQISVYDHRLNTVPPPQIPNSIENYPNRNNIWLWLTPVILVLVGSCIGFGIYMNHKTRQRMEAVRLADSIMTADSIRAVQADAARQAAEEKKTYNGHDHVDLGLSVDWATCNVGASQPEENGGYYGWADPTGEDNTSNVTDRSQENGEPYDIGPWVSSSYGGPNPPSNICGTDLDIARVKLGGFWRLPSSAEMDELRNKCKWKWTTLNGNHGYQVIGPNGHTIFLPAAGSPDVNYGSPGEGYYWTGTLRVTDSRNDCADFLCFYSEDPTGIPTDGVFLRSFHCSVRAVCPKK